MSTVGVSATVYFWHGLLSSLYRGRTPKEHLEKLCQNRCGNQRATSETARQVSARSEGLPGILHESCSPPVLVCPQVQQLPSAFEGMCHLHAEAFFKVHFPLRVMRVGCPC